MSDEFNTEGRQFNDGYDPTWTAMQKSDDDQTGQGRKSLQYYNASYCFTKNGSLNILTTDEDTKWRGFNPFLKHYYQMKRHFRSGMINSWNKFCYTGGILEFDVKFPGKPKIGGLWPAVWLLGNLGRATYEESTNKIWPWSYKKCDRKLQKAQEISGCDSTSHYSMNAGQGRGSTEIDVLEIMSGDMTDLPIVKNGVHQPYAAMTLQLAPGIPRSQRRPESGTLPEWGFTWYSNLTYGPNTSINPFFYGTYLTETKALEPISRSKAESYQCDSLSCMLSLDESFWDEMHTFRLEWQPGDDGYVHWYVDGDYKFGVEAVGLEPWETQIPNEPSYLIVNTAISNSWGFPDPPFGCDEYDCKTDEGKCGFFPGFCETLPATFEMDFIRVYQNKNDSRQTIGCNPPGYPTRKYIKAHEFKYMDTTKDSHPLKPLKVGGARCKIENSDYCGTHARGSCSHSTLRCVCRPGWMGPRCLVQKFHDDGEDWDVGKFEGIELPFIPSSLGVVAVVFVIALIASVSVFSIRRKKATVDTEEIPTESGTGTGY
eukprot:CAMPEP_0182419324 /NCGR_PEP_ID=MMETSP1167-20130531/3781_1 /TAXON_ID=2988 /ORGANISM="Mallomonas Sp, Strain CCMP3275" /LENGTH=541 /DNA_ID=CAMNT_0024594167 /DNA_START=220 /DNA_END=1845 /DNA_ORIENTATION=+